MRPRYVWRAIHYRERDSASALVLGLPEGVDLEEPQDASSELIRPDRAVADLGESLEGDGSPLSYLQASLLVREMLSFGAAGHGISDWAETIIVDTAPSSGGLDAGGWRWFEPIPSDWRPSVMEDEGGCVVVFYGEEFLGQHRVCRFVDHYAPGTLSSTRSRQVLGVGPGGILR